ncbi:MAG: ferritin-like domain-containing protein [Bryobacteraceae bacterium]
MAKKDLIAEVIDASPSRRKLLKSLGVASAAATAMFAVGDRKLSAAAPSSGPSAVDILQFALNLEYLEAEFYTYAVFGNGIDSHGIGINGSGNPGVTTGGKKVNFSNNFVFTGAVAAEIGADERAHVNLIRGALTQAGVTPVAKPGINLNALGVGFGNEYEFLTLARVFEDVGVSAYGYAAGVASLATSPYIGTAARILAAEAQHVGNIRLEVARLGVKTKPALDGVDILPPPSGTLFLSVDESTGLTAVRSPGQVLFLVYGGVASSVSGGFYPTGVNGTINTSSAMPA